MNGYWIFYTDVDADQYFFQQSTSPVFAITVEGHGTFVLPFYEIRLGNDSLAMGYGGLADSYTVGSYAIDPTAPPGIQGMFGLSTSDLNVLSNATLPLSLPAVSAFNLYNNWSLQNGSPEDTDYWAVGGQLDSLSINPVPEPSPGILLMGSGIAFLLLNRFKKREKEV